MLMTLCETGTRGLIAAAFGPVARGETYYAQQLASNLTPGMLLLADRAFHTNDLLAQAARRGAQFLVRCTSRRHPPILTLLPDGSYLTRIAGLTLRVIEAEIRTRTADGSTFGETYRLLTTLTDHRADPAHQLVRLYHERWEIECAYLALRHTLLKGRVLRSKDPAGLTQEVWGLLTLYQALFQEVNAVTEIWPRQTSALTHQCDGPNVASRSHQLVHLPLVPGREPTPQRIVHPHIESLGSTACLTVDGWLRDLDIALRRFTHGTDVSAALHELWRQLETGSETAEALAGLLALSREACSALAHAQAGPDRTPRNNQLRGD
ncbi:transposase [Streptomyces fodineus]|uniref:transposase n=1 Tax=Streptomyces fodineus TaxID=1904616 RepID=UPI000B0B9954|nr:transposase [Streptomyces fodineus]